MQFNRFTEKILKKNDEPMILTLHVPGTTVKRVQDSLKVYIPARIAQDSPALDDSLNVENSGRDVNTSPEHGSPGEKLGNQVPDDDGENKTRDEESTGKPVDGEHGDTGETEAETLADNARKLPTSFQVAISQLSSVIVSGNVSITIPVLQHLARSAVPVIFTEKNKPIAILNPFAQHGSVRVRKEQFATIDTERGFYIAKQIVGGTLENKARLLLGLAKNRASTNPAVETMLRDHAEAIRGGKQKLDTLQYKTDQTANRFNLLGIEGDGTRIYFTALKEIIPTAFNFSGRNRRPPRDPINSMLSLGYTILQGYVNIGIAAVGLEPYAGFMHADRAGKPSLSLDLMEEFRQPVVDRLILSLVTRGGIKPSHFTTTTTGVLLTERGKDIFIPRLIKRVAPLRPSEDKAGSSSNLYKDIIKQARDMSRFLLGLQSTYSPYLMAW